MAMAYFQWIKLKKNYDLVKPILEEYHERNYVEQFDLRVEFRIRDLSFQHIDTRGDFLWYYNGSSTFKQDEAILVIGNSGAGYIH
jgi:ABC-type bacteriocin/lantibiotic exporter with double-glycine peptidase domain